jgi:glycosyltransferase involved in cell wall biosynthesis
MRLCFLDFSNWDYNVDGPLLRPLGGSQSALCYLAVELAKAGHSVTVMTGTTQPGTVKGVECVNLENVNPWFLKNRAFDACIVQNSAGYSKLRDILPSSTRLILWTQHEPVQPAMSKLAKPEIADRWDEIVCVSEWQRGAYVEAFKLPSERMTVIRNAIGPSFEKLFRDKDDLVNAKSNPLTLAYTSTPYRGLKHLPFILEELQEARPEATLNVYSSMAVYPGQSEARFRDLYIDLKRKRGINYVGSLPQPELAERLATSHILAYPCIFPETSCIAVMEAMAAGMRVVTTGFAALPETTEGFAYLVQPPEDWNDQREFVRNYTSAITHPYRIEDEADALCAQVAHMNTHHTWSIRCRQWSEFLQRN